MAQGDNKTNTRGTDCMFVMNHGQLGKMHTEGRIPTYARVVVDFWPQKEDPNRVQIIAGRNLIEYPGELTTRTADLNTTNIVWNSVVSTAGARYTCLDVSDFYFETPTSRFKYIKMPLPMFPSWTQKQYNLDANTLNGFAYWEISKDIYVLPQAGMIANKQLRKHLKLAGFYAVARTPGPYNHRRLPIQFSFYSWQFWS